MELNYEPNNLVGEVVAINIRNSDEMTPGSYKDGIFKENYGLIGDKHSSPGERQVTILSAEARNRINTIEIDGLCVKRFYENLTIKDLDTSKLIIGQVLIIGEAFFQITGIGKRCFPECDFVKRSEACSLQRGVIFAKVLSGGRVKVGEGVFKKKAN
ncbi:MAG: MOSC domain-containing protein [Tissierellales bacterium]